MQIGAASDLKPQELRLSTRSQEAQAEFRAGLDAIENLLIAEGSTRMQRAIAADPKFALARAFHAAYAVNLSADARSAELQQAAADAMNATLGELLVVLSLRVPAGAERRSTLKAAVDAVPDDRHVLYLHALHLESPHDRVRSFEALNRRFPDFAPAYRELGYVRLRELADLPAALLNMQRYLKLQPQNPNAYHATAGVLQRAGRFDEAVEHYQQALDLDLRFVPAFQGLAEVALLQGRTAEARKHFEDAIAQQRAPAPRLGLREAHALTYVTDGNVRTAMTELARVANDAENTGYQATAARIHRTLAVLEAAFGNKSLVDSRLRKAESLSSANAIEQRLFAAASYALAGDRIGARPHVSALTESAARSTSLAWKRHVQSVHAIVEASAGNVEAAITAANAAGSFGGLGKALAAENLKRAGKHAEAKALANEVLATTDVDVMAAIARQRAKRI